MDDVLHKSVMQHGMHLECIVERPRAQQASGNHAMHLECMMDALVHNKHR